MLKQNLSQRMLQKLSPQQIQLMKLLQIPTSTLDQRIQEELEANPALDEGEQDNQEVFDLTEEEREKEEKEDYELDDYLKEYIEDDPISYKTKAEDYGSDSENKAIPIAVENSFHEHLQNQVGMMSFDSEKFEKIATQVIGSIDSDGYLRRENVAIKDDLLFAQNIDVQEEEIEEVIKRVQKFEPPGLGARDLQECLLIQLEAKANVDDDKATRRSQQIAVKILKNHFEEFSKKHYTKLQKNLFISESELRDAINEILKLNPKPASNFAGAGQRANQYIVPDFIVSNKDGELDLSLNNRNAPDLRVNDHYQDMLRAYKITTEGRRSTKKEKEAVMFIKQKIDSAKWFIDAIKQRQETLLNTMYSIMQFQYNFFMTGDEKQLKPMILKDISEVTGLDISTISRVANSKFVQTEFGTKRLKDFFSESLQAQDGTLVSTLEVKNILGDIIAAEDKRKPHSDEKLKNMLEKRGYNIARRTVAKYREQLNIPVARLRKEL